MPTFHTSKTLIFNLYINCTINSKTLKIQTIQNDTKMKGTSSTTPCHSPTSDYFQPFVFSFGGYLNNPKRNTLYSTPCF